MDNDAVAAAGTPRRGLLAGGAASAAALLLASCRQDADQGGGDDGGNGEASIGNFPETPAYRFVFVNHVTTNPFFTATQYGIEDASAMLGTEFQWTGSQDSVAAEMVDAMDTAINGNADGIAVSIVDPTAFNEPIQRALDQGIPVVAYNANGAPDQPNPALAYIGQDLYDSGVQMGRRIASLVESGTVALFIATPGQLNIQPRLDGAKAGIEEAGADIEVDEVATGAEVSEELSRIDAYYQGHTGINGMFAVDAGSTQGVAQVISKYNLHEEGVRGGGYDLLPKTLELLDQGVIDFTIDQQPYQQGFWPVLQLYLWHVSGGVMNPSTVSTGLRFLTQETAGRYLETQSRYEGDSEQHQLIDPPSEIVSSSAA